MLAREFELRPNDAIGVVFAPSSESGLFEYLTKVTHPIQHCPPSLGTLWIYGRAQFGIDWANQVLHTLGYQ